MKILVVSNLFPPDVLGGYEILCAQVCRALRARGHEVRVLTSAPPRRDAGVGHEPEVQRRLELETPFDRPARRSRRRRAAVSARNAAVTRVAIASERPDRVFVWSQLRLSLGAAIAAEASGVPVAYTLNDEHLAGYLPARLQRSPRSWAATLLDRLAARELTLSAVRLRHATCISAALRDALVAKGVPVGRARVIHQGIPIERFPARLERARRTGPARLLYAGQLHEYKGVHTLLEAAALLSRGRGTPEFELTIAGQGQAGYEARLRGLSRQAGVPVRFLGRLPHADVPALHREHDVLVFPSIWKEPFGLSHLEAMASGTPVVSTDEGGPQEFLDHERNALVFRAGDACDLAATLGRLLADEGLGARLAREGRACVERRFTLARYVSDIETFLEDAA